MTIDNLKELFFKELSGIYPKQEIESFFYLLTEFYFHLKRIDIALDPHIAISLDPEQKFNSAITKLKDEIPIQYITGETEFFGLPFYVDKNVLIPRPETEELAHWIIKKVESKKLKVKSKRLNVKRSPNNGVNLNILDIGTGSGCIAISLAKNIPNSKVWALDISKKAIEIAQKNAKTNGVEIRFLNDDILKLEKLPVKFDIIVSNPPYVKEIEKSKMQNNVLLNEPHLALFVKDHKPLIFYDRIADFALTNLHKSGVLFFEINQAYGKETVELLKEKGFHNIELRKDIFENDRMIRADNC